MHRPTSLDASYAYCHDVMRRSARNFYWGMSLLPAEKRRAMYALYAFMRIADDIADDPAPPVVNGFDGEKGDPRGPCTAAPRVGRCVMHHGDTEHAEKALPGNGNGAVALLSKRNDVEHDPGLAADLRRRELALIAWRADFDAALAGDLPAHPLWPALVDSVRRFSIPAPLFHDAIDGQLQDLVVSDYADFPALYGYCRRVASTVGIAAVHIWGFADERAILLAEQRGIAMQLTNILRDLAEDAARGRCYLPADERRAADCPAPTEAPPHRLAPFLRAQAARAAGFYDDSADLESLIAPDSRPTLTVMTHIYRGLLTRIAANPCAVLHERIRLSTLSKLGILLRATMTPV